MAHVPSAAAPPHSPDPLGTYADGRRKRNEGLPGAGGNDAGDTNRQAAGGEMAGPGADMKMLQLGVRTQDGFLKVRRRARFGSVLRKFTKLKFDLYILCSIFRANLGRRPGVPGWYSSKGGYSHPGGTSTIIHGWYCSRRGQAESKAGGPAAFTSASCLPGRG